MVNQIISTVNQNKSNDQLDEMKRIIEVCFLDRYEAMELYDLFRPKQIFPSLPKPRKTKFWDDNNVNDFIDEKVTGV